MSNSTPCSSVVLAAVATALLLLLLPAAAAAAPASAVPAPAPGPAHGQQPAPRRWCDARRDLFVNQTAGALQPDGTKLFDVVVTNEGQRGAVREVHLNCGHRFESERRLDSTLFVQISPGDCLLINGSTIAPGGRVSFAYAGFLRYSMAVVNATCTSPPGLEFLG